VRRVQTAVLGVVAQSVLLGVLALTVGIASRGWSVGVAVGVLTNVWLARASWSAGATRLGPANLVTLARATIVGATAALVADAATHPLPVTPTLTLAAIALSLDAVDGQVARATASTSLVGARFDGEVDALLILVLSVAVTRTAGWWVLAIGLWRYAFGAAGWVRPWLRGQLPPSHWRKTVAAVQGVALAVSISGLLPRSAVIAVLAVALSLLTESFAHDIWWLRTQRSVPTKDPSRRGRVVGHVATGLAIAVVWAALATPDRPVDLMVTAFLRIPIEGVVLVAVAWLLPGRGRRFLALMGGLALAVLVLVRVLDVGFFSVLDRPFNPVTDWSSIGPALGVLSDSIGRTRAILLTIGAVTLIAAAMAVTTVATIRVTRVAARHRRTTVQTVASLGAAWTLFAVLGVSTAPGAPVASRSTAVAISDEVHQIQTGLRDQHTFNTELAAGDPYLLSPRSSSLAGLRGKDVLLVFIESYGQVAVQGSSFSPQIDALLKSGTTTLSHAGFTTRSAFLTSPTFGGGSWLAHSTMESGLWINSQARYKQLAASKRFTLSQAFERGGWRTVFDMPATTGPWPEGQPLYHFDTLYESTNVGYAGPSFSFAKIPDQYTLQVLNQRELAPASRPPLFAEVVLDSSHSPWTPLPHLVPWDALGNGAIFGPMTFNEASPFTVLHSTKRASAAYAQSVEYTLSALVSFLARSHDKNLVVIALGDHQPAPIVSGYQATHNVPVMIFARDKNVIDRMSGWGWQSGLLPDPSAPVWRMDTFRNRFLKTFGPRGSRAVGAGGSGS
jgi:phosphatidylglycerophosphate synthase